MRVATGGRSAALSYDAPTGGLGRGESVHPGPPDETFRQASAPQTRSSSHPPHVWEHLRTAASALCARAAWRRSLPPAVLRGGIAQMPPSSASSAHCCSTAFRSPSSTRSLRSQPTAVAQRRVRVLETLILARRDVQALLGYDESIAAVEQAFRLRWPPATFGWPGRPYRPT